jgi:hypothetical protein
MIELSDLLIDHQEFHSDLQMDSFITARSGGTLYGCYKQALRELATRVRALRERYFGRRLLLLEIEEHDLAGTPRDLIHAESKRMALRESDSILADTEREFLRFYAQATATRESLRSQGVRFPLDAATRDRLDREMWVHHLKCRVAVELNTMGRATSVTVELIQALPQPIRESICAEIFCPDAPRHLMEWFMSYDFDLPQPHVIPAMSARRLIGCCE